MHKKTITTVTVFLAVLMAFCQISAEPIQEKETVFIVNDYRYETGSSSANSDTGQSLCGNRCNALSVDYQNYIKPPGFRLIKVASNKEVVVDLNNSFIDGSCTCVADEYVVRVNELYMTK